MVQPIIKWAGGKSKIKEEFAKIYQKSDCELFIDLFCGSLCLPLSINCKKNNYK